VAELALQFEAIRTGVQVAINFEPVANGFTPELTMSATHAAQGAPYVEVTRDAHMLPDPRRRLRLPRQIIQTPRAAPAR
jgi:hypothetical protein